MRTYEDQKDDLQKALGPVRRWQEGDIMFGENDFVLLAWVYTDDPAKIGTIGPHGPNQIFVEYVARPSQQEDGG